MFSIVRRLALGRPDAEASIIETDDRERWLLISSDDLLTPYLWECAVQDDAAGVVVQTGGSYDVVLAEGAHEALSGSETRWERFPEPPTYVQAVERFQGIPEPRQGSFVHLHTHTEYSALDGLTTMRELCELAVADDNRAVAVTDHGTCAGHPALQREADRAGIKPIFGLEAYFIDDRLERPQSGDAEAAKRLRGYSHLILLAKSDEGLRNLWALSTEGYRDGFYYKPRIDWDSLRRHPQGIIATSACLGGPVSRLILSGDTDGARARLGRFLEVFGPDFFLEIQPGDQEDQRILNRALVEFGRELSIPLVAAADGHFPTAADADVHKTWLACQTSGDNEAYWHFDHTMTESEMRERLAYLGPQVVDEAVRNTVEIAEQCDARIESKVVMPVYYRQGGYDRDAERLREICESNWGRIKSTAHSPEVYRERFERELKMITEKSYCGYFIMVADYCIWAKDNGILVGPGRGSGAGSLIAFLMRITEVDPVHYDILFERFITEGRETLPDFDVDLPASKRQEIQEYIRGKYGDDHVLRVGTHLRYKSKGIIGKLFGVFRDRGELGPEAFTDARKISDIIGEAEAGTAGLGLSWEELWAQEGDQLEPYRLKYPQIFALAERLVGRLNSYGQHPAGMIISTRGPLLDRLPLRRGDDDGMMISQFEFDDLDRMGLIKFDILTIRTLDTLQFAVDGAREHFGVEVDVYDFDIEYADPMVWEEIGGGHTAGMFQIETASGTRLARRMLPASIADLADMGSIVRPGPMRSGLTESYLRRRAGEEPVSFPDDRLERFLAPTQGVMIFQEQVMQACMTLAGYSSTEADGVRKILGKKKVDQVVEAGYKFVDGCVAHGMDRDTAKVLWDQMAEFAKYCVTGDAEISLAGSNDGGSTISVESAYKRLHTPLRDPVRGRARGGQEFHGPCDACGAVESPHWIRGRCNACYVWARKFRDPQRGVHALSYYADGRIRPARILDVIDQGDQEVWRISLSDNSSISASGSHRHLTPEGYRTVSELRVGDRLVIDGGYEMPSGQESARRNRLSPLGTARRGPGPVNAHGEGDCGYIDGSHVIWREWQRDHPKVCAQCGETEGRISVAHLNGDHQDNRDGNYAWLCDSCHLRYDYAVNDRRRRWQKGHRAESRRITGIVYEGVRPTYDVVMESPHNFVANGIVTHNSFGKAHAVSYAMITYWTAWWKVHYPVPALTALLSTVDKERVPEFVKEARRLSVSILPPDINVSGRGFRPDGNFIRYGLDAIKGVGAKAVDAVTEAQPYTSFEDYQERKGKNANSGVTLLLAKVGAFDSVTPHRRALVDRLEAEKDGSAVQCVFKRGEGKELSQVCTFDWEAEPRPVGRTGKLLKARPLPKRCSRACRQYTAPGPVALELVPSYTDKQIRDIEQEMLGVHLSSTAFDMLEAQDRELVRQQAELLDRGLPGVYLVAGTITGVRKIRDRTGRDMAFFNLGTETVDIDVACFADAYQLYGAHIKAGSFVICDLRRDGRGSQLKTLTPLDG